MSVLECDRYGCDNIMCHRFSTIRGHICDECFETLCIGNLQDFYALCGHSITQDEKRTIMNRMFPQT